MATKGKEPLIRSSCPLVYVKESYNIAATGGLELFKKFARREDTEESHDQLKADSIDGDFRSLNVSSNASKGDIPETEIVEELITQVNAVNVEGVRGSDDGLKSGQHTVRSKYDQQNVKPNTNKGHDFVDSAGEEIGLAGYASAEATKNYKDIIYGFDKCPYFSDRRTIEFICQSTTMFIMRGLPGSGKSTIVRFLRHLYPNSVVCSADDYFLHDDGEYRFDQSKLSQAHAECQNKATTHCSEDTPVVIIDNTNIMRWEMGFYLRLAQNERFYHTLIVEPQTPWRHDVTELAKRNKHGVDIDILHKKLQNLQDVFPLYYGWFLTKKDSSKLLKTAKDRLKSSLVELNNSAQFDHPKLKDIVEDFDIYYTDPKGMLHCTSRFVGSNFSHAYHHSNKVKDSMGKVFTLKVTGIVYTESSISARVNLNLSSCDISTACDIYEKDEEEMLRKKYRDTAKKDQVPKHFYHGCSAHITLKYSNNSQPKVAGEDILKICESSFHGKGRFFAVKTGKIHVFPGNTFYLEFKEPMQLDTLFHGYYSPARR